LFLNGDGAWPLHLCRSHRLSIAGFLIQNFYSIILEFTIAWQLSGNMNFETKEKDIAGTVRRVFASPKVIHYPYHNLTHTEEVLRHCKEIAVHFRLSRIDHFILAVSAWLHDIGHLYGEYEGHEERGVQVMKQYTQDLPAEMTDVIGRCILATKFPTHPVSLLEEIICDADTYHLGTPYFRQTDILVEKEMEMRSGKAFPDWHRKSLQFLQQHTFFTGYCKDLLGKGKQQNIAWLKAQINDQT
jgi:predicted HD phosphohydrolase